MNNTDVDNTKKDTLSVTDAAFVVVGIVFGSGIFVAPQIVAQFCGSVPLSLLAWPVGALIAVCGSMCYAECTSRVAADGGFYAVFRHTFGEAFANTAGLVSQLVISPAALAGPVTIGGQAIALALFAQGAQTMPAFMCTLLLLCTASALNVLGVHFSKVAQRIFVTAKVLLVAFLVVACLVSHGDAAQAVAPVASGLPQANETGPNYHLLAAFFGVLLWTFDGWTDVTMIAPRMRRPGADLSKALVLGLFTLAAIFMAVQYAVMHILGLGGTAASPQPFSAAIQAVFGAHSRPLVDGAIVLSTFTSAHGVMWMVASLTQVMSKQGALPKVLAKYDARLGRPLCCVGFVTALAAAACTLSDFNTIVALFSFFIWVFYGLLAVSLAMLRRRRIAAPGTWIAPGGPLCLGVVGIVSCLMTASHVMAFPWACLGCTGGFFALFVYCRSRTARA